MISIKTGCCLKASSCQAELLLRHRHHNRGCPSHNLVWLAQGENGSLWRVRPAAGWQVCICEARCAVYLLSFCRRSVSAFLARKGTRTKWHGEYSPQCEEANTCFFLIPASHIHTDYIPWWSHILLNAWTLALPWLQGHWFAVWHSPDAKIRLLNVSLIPHMHWHAAVRQKLCTATSLSVILESISVTCAEHA